MIAPMSGSWHDAARPGARFGGVVEAHDVIASTNDRARALLEGGAPDGVVVVAELQTAGRGRMGRTWTSPAGRNVTASVGLRPAITAADAWRIGLAGALALHAAASRWAPVRLKWPNDLVAPGGTKVAGMLIEAASEGARLRHVVLGFGVNVNWRPDELPDELTATATSLGSLAGTTIDRVRLLRDLLDALEGEISELEAGLSPLGRYRAACATLGARVTVDTSDGRVEGIAVDLDARGALLVRTDDGDTMSIASGEVVRVRPATGR